MKQALGLIETIGLVTAIEAADAMVKWAQGLVEQPNAYLGHANLLRGRLCIAQSAWGDALAALDAAAAQFAAVFRDDPRGQELLQHTLQLRAQALAGAR